MPNPHATWRIERARRLAPSLLAFEGIEALIVAGSVARNLADAYSDLELAMFWEAVPGDAVRAAMADALQADFLFGYDGPSREDQLLVHGLHVDLWHIAAAHEEEVIRGVLEEHRTDLGALNAMDTLRCCIPLHGQPLVRRWKSLAEGYPRGLALALLREHLPSFRVDQLATCALRQDPTGFYAELCHLQHAAFLALLALNRRYFPTFKWMYPTLETLEIKPDAIAARFRHALAADREQAVADTRRLLFEVLELVERAFPELESAAHRRRLEYLRPATEPDPVP